LLHGGRRTVGTPTDGDECLCNYLFDGIPSPLNLHAIMTARSTPQDGDIVISEERREGKAVYVLHTAPGADQCAFRSREDAMKQAVTFARRQQVRAWLTDGDHDFTLLEDFRAVESA
jgi:hypothetical protein